MLKVVNQGTHVPVVDVVDGVATVESTNIAEVFEKRHDHVLRDIENILISLPSDAITSLKFSSIASITSVRQFSLRPIALHATVSRFLSWATPARKPQDSSGPTSTNSTGSRLFLKARPYLRRNLSELCSREIRLLKTCYEGSPAKWMRRPWATSS